MDYEGQKCELLYVKQVLLEDFFCSDGCESSRNISRTCQQLYFNFKHNM